MTRLSSLCVSACLLVGSTAEAVVLYESLDPGHTLPEEGGMFPSGLDLLAGFDPDDASNPVGEIVLNGSGKFANTNPGEKILEPESLGRPFRFSADYNIPADTAFDALPDGTSPDLFWLQISFDGVNSGSAGFIGAADAGSGWNTVGFTGVIPADATNFRPLLVLADGGFGDGVPNGDGATTAMYFDNFVFETLDVADGDFNLDGVVDGADYTVYRDNFGAEDDSALFNLGDGVPGITAADYDVWAANYGAEPPLPPAGTAVPESSTSLMVIGCLLAGTLRGATSRLAV